MNNTMVKVITNEIYPPHITVFLGTSATEIKTYFDEHCPENKIIDFFIYTCAGYTIQDAHGDVWLIIHSDYCTNHSIIAHEAFHATEYIMDFVGVKHSSKSSEAFAYLLQHIVKKIIE